MIVRVLLYQSMFNFTLSCKKISAYFSLLFSMTGYIMNTGEKITPLSLSDTKQNEIAVFILSVFET